MPTADTPETPEQAASRRRTALANEFGGYDLRSAVKVHWKSATFTTWSEAVAELVHGITVTVPCASPHPTQQGRWIHHKHKARFEPDGSIELLHHPAYAQNPEAELMLAALGGAMSACVAMASHFPTQKLVPGSVLNHNAVNVRLRALHTAIAWAQRPETVWNREFGDTHLRFGITPAVRDEWEADGWEPELALRFQQTYTPLALANQWREAGETTLRAAANAGRGEFPNAEAQWSAVGFTPARSARWRKTGYSPAEAYEWDRHNITPSVAKRFRRDLSPTTTPSLDTVKEWCGAGVPCTTVLSWIQKTNGDLPTALAWKRARLTPDDYERVRQWNTAHPSRALTREQVAAFRDVNFPLTDSKVLADTIDAGFSLDLWRETTSALADGRAPELLATLIDHDVRRVQRNVYSWGFADPRSREWAVRRFRDSGVATDVAEFIVGYLLREARSGDMARVGVQ